MAHESALGAVSRLGAASLGVFRGRAAVEEGVTRKQLAALVDGSAIERVLPDTYRLTAVAPCREQDLRGALLWAGDDAVAADPSAGELYRLEGVTAAVPEIVVPATSRVRSQSVIVHRSHEPAALMVRYQRGLRVTGVECTMLRLAAVLDEEAFEIACEDARRRRLTSVPALNAYVDRYGRPGRGGVAATRRLLRELDPVHAARSTLEVKTRRLLVANGVTDFVREFPLEWNGRTYRDDFVFERERTILETNGRRWHDDPADYEHDNETWSVPGRHGYRIVFATWDKVTRRPDDLLSELAATRHGTRHSWS
jgi:very-short-patch-repair endonuclease